MKCRARRPKSGHLGKLEVLDDDGHGSHVTGIRHCLLRLPIPRLGKGGGVHDEEGAGQTDRCSLNRRDDVQASQARKSKSNLCDCWRINSDDGPVRTVPRAPGWRECPG